VAVEEGVERGVDADAAFGAGGAEQGLEKAGIGGMHLEAHGADVLLAPALHALLPSEVAYAHAFAAIAEDAVFVARALGAEVGIGEGVVENAGGAGEIVEASRLAGGDRRGADKHEASAREPEEESSLHHGAAVDQKDVLGGIQIFGRKERGELGRIAELLGLGDGESDVNFAGESIRQGGIAGGESLVGCGAAGEGANHPDQQDGLERSSGLCAMHGTLKLSMCRATQFFGRPMKIHLITTGGTIEKIYSEQSGQVENLTAKIDRYLQYLRLPDAHVEVTPLMNKDSLEMTDEDRARVLAVVRAKAAEAPVVITHGTDTMVETGRLLKREIAGLKYPIVLTGAMTPLGFERSDGLQNLTESLFAARTLAPGVWIVMHGQVFDVDRARKDREQARFVGSEV
jgi:L-asparaginase